MTCVVSAVDGDKVVMMGDHSYMQTDHHTMNGCKKVLKSGEFICGFAGFIDPAMATLNAIEKTPLIGKTLDERRNELLARFNKVQPVRANNTYLVGHKGKLYTVLPNTVLESNVGFIGSDVNLYAIVYKYAIARGDSVKVALASTIVFAADYLPRYVVLDHEGPTIEEV